MKTEISRIKIKQILKSYIKENKTSNIILEQNQDVSLSTKLQGMLSCFNPDIKPTVIQMSDDGNPNHKYSIQTTGTNGGLRYWYIDGMVSVYDATTKSINFVKTKTGEIKKWKVELCSQGTQSAGYTPQQKSFIESWKRTNVGAKLENELQGEEKNTYTKQLVSPKSDRVFPEDLYMWLPPANISTADIAEYLGKAVNAQIPQTPDACKLLVKTFYRGYKAGTAVNLSPSDIKSNANKVKACRDLFYQKIGRLKGGRKFDSMLDELAQVTSTEPWYVRAR